MSKANIGLADRVFRIVLGLGLLAFAAGLFGATPLNWLGIVGVVPLTTALMGLCPLYSLFGWSTSRGTRPS
jgi:hypothetical protein